MSAIFLFLVLTSGLYCVYSSSNPLLLHLIFPFKVPVSLIPSILINYPIFNVFQFFKHIIHKYTLTHHHTYDSLFNFSSKKILAAQWQGLIIVTRIRLKAQSRFMPKLPLRRAKEGWVTRQKNDSLIYIFTRFLSPCNFTYLN